MFSSCCFVLKNDFDKAKVSSSGGLHNPVLAEFGFTFLNQWAIAAFNRIKIETGVPAVQR